MHTRCGPGCGPTVLPPAQSMYMPRGPVRDVGQRSMSSRAGPPLLRTLKQLEDTECRRSHDDAAVSSTVVILFHASSLKILAAPKLTKSGCRNQPKTSHGKSPKIEATEFQGNFDAAVKLETLSLGAKSGGSGVVFGTSQTGMSESSQSSRPGESTPSSPHK